MQFFQPKELDSRTKECFIDDKTGLNNSLGLNYLVTHILKQHKRYEENWSLVAFDASKEKFARLECDNLSQKDIDLAVSKMLTAICRNSDILSYCGNSVFCILSRVFEGDDTVKFANKILKHLKNLEYKNCKIEVNAKFGITFSKYEDNAENFFLRVQNALQKAQDSKEIVVVGA